MDQQEPRRQYIFNLYKICEKVTLDNDFIEALKQHSNGEFIKEVMKFGENDMAKKVLILTEFTKERGTCDEMVKILEKCGQTEAADLLKEHNKSPPFKPYTTEINLTVTPALTMKKGESKLFRMDKNPRGMCIIINNVKDVLEKESLRFKNIFEQLCFKVELFYNMSANQMKTELKKLSQQESLSSDNAFVVMIISHGRDEKVIGFDNEELPIPQIVDIFSEINCKALQRKPKLFFFNCCRNKETDVSVKATIMSDNKIMIVLDTVVQSWINKNKYTLICFTCAEGYKSWFIPNEFTFFGQAFSHCIAQYACDRSFISILNLTCERMSETGSPEIRLCKMTRDLYLNPGLPKI